MSVPVAPGSDKHTSHVRKIQAVTTVGHQEQGGAMPRRCCSHRLRYAGSLEVVVGVVVKPVRGVGRRDRAGRHGALGSHRHFGFLEVLHSADGGGSLWWCHGRR